MCEEHTSKKLIKQMGGGLCMLLSSFTPSNVSLNLYDLLSCVKHRYLEKKKPSVHVFIYTFKVNGVQCCLDLSIDLKWNKGE